MARIAAATVVVLALLAGASTASARTAERYPPAFERAFMASCKSSSSGMESVCRCALRWIERRYAYRKLVWIYMHDKARMRKIMVSAAYACVH